ncbi:MAG: nitroreductase family protein [bacterium]|nr:nitroreductase family protein [bacterium]
MKPVLALSKEHRSIRNYSQKPIPPKMIGNILEAAGQAPSGLNRQPWLFAVVEDPELKKLIREESERVEVEFYRKITEKTRKEFEEMKLTVKKEFLTEAPALIAVFCDTESTYCKESVWISIGWLLLAATEAGLSTLTYTPNDLSFLNKLLNIDYRFHPEVIIPIGYGDKKGSKSRKTSDEIIKYF